MDERDHVSAVWAEDWDSPEDAAYDLLIAKEARLWGKQTLEWAESVDGEDPDSDA